MATPAMAVMRRPPTGQDAGRGKAAVSDGCGL